MITWHGSARQGLAWLGTAGQGMARRGEAWPGKARQGVGVFLFSKNRIYYY